VGNKDRYILFPVLFYKCPLFHSLDLENFPPSQTLFYESLRLYFHFSGCTTGTSIFYLSLSPPFPLTVAPGQVPGPHLAFARPPSATRSALPASVRESRQTPLFSTRTAMLR
jgi:hypothetical protein